MPSPPPRHEIEDSIVLHNGCPVDIDLIVEVPIDFLCQTKLSVITAYVLKVGIIYIAFGRDSS